MQTSSASSTEVDPPWLKSPSQEDRSKRLLDTDEESLPNSHRKTTPLSAGRHGGRRQTLGYGSDGEEDDRSFDDDCCCCPLDPVSLGIVFFHAVCFCLGLAGIAVNIKHLTKPKSTIDTGSVDGNYQALLDRSYSVGFCILMVICEIDWRFGKLT